MPADRRRRIVRRAALVVVLLMGFVATWLAVREPPEIRRSRAITLGMTQTEVEAVMGQAVMGQADGSWTSYLPVDVASGGSGLDKSTTGGLLFGTMLGAKIRVRDLLGLKKDSFGLKSNVELNDWPVRVRLDDHGRVEYIRRGRHVEQPQD